MMNPIFFQENGVFLSLGQPLKEVVRFVGVNQDHSRKEVLVLWGNPIDGVSARGDVMGSAAVVSRTR
jgi:hypothetical protein